jgi:hypothetical protein
MSHALPPAPPLVERPDYQPLSALALASLVLSGLFASVVLLAVGVALVRAQAVLLSTWFLLLPLAGSVLGALARWRIRRAQGALAGLSLAGWGLWLGVVFGLGYGAYYFATALAIQKQAHDFLTQEGEESGFLPHLQKAAPPASDLMHPNISHLYRAFLLTTPHGRRLGINPDDRLSMEKEFNRPVGKAGRGHISRFTDSEFVQIVFQATQEGEGQPWQALGTASWDSQGGNNYRVECSYRFRTREGQVDVVLPVVGEVDKLSGRRYWHVDWSNLRILPSSQRTPLGQALEKIRQQAIRAANSQLQGQSPAPSTLPADRTDWDHLLIVPDEKHGIEDIRAWARQDLDGLRRRQLRPHTRLSVGEQPACPWDQDEQKHLRLFLRFSYIFGPPQESESGPLYLAEGTVLVRSQHPLSPLEFRGDGWEVLSLALERINPMPPEMANIISKTLNTP